MLYYKNMKLTPTPCQHNEEGVRQRKNLYITGGLHRHEVEVGVCQGCLNLVGRRGGEREWRVLLIARPRLPDDAPDGQKSGEEAKKAKIDEVAAPVKDVVESTPGGAKDEGKK